MDLKKVITATLVPAVLLTVFGVINTVLNFVINTYVPLLCFLPLILTLIMFVISCAILLYAGYAAARKYQLDIVGASLTGLLAGLVSSIIVQLVSLVLILVGILPSASSNPLGAAASGAFNLIGWIIWSVLVIGAYTVVGAVLGAIGGLIGRKK